MSEIGFIVNFMSREHRELVTSLTMLMLSPTIKADMKNAEIQSVDYKRNHFLLHIKVNLIANRPTYYIPQLMVELARTIKLQQVPAYMARYIYRERVSDRWEITASNRYDPSNDRPVYSGVSKSLQQVGISYLDKHRQELEKRNG